MLQQFVHEQDLLVHGIEVHGQGYVTLHTQALEQPRIIDEIGAHQN
jgi:hypothetical protein